MHLKNKPFVIKYVPDCVPEKTQKMCDKAIIENGGSLSLLLTATKIKKFKNKLLITINRH